MLTPAQEMNLQERNTENTQSTTQAIRTFTAVQHTVF